MTSILLFKVNFVLKSLLTAFTCTLYVYVKLSRNQSWVILSFSVLRDSILDSLFLILNLRRIKNHESS